MRLLFAIALTSILGLAFGTVLGGLGAGLSADLLADRPATLDESTVRFALARGGSIGLLAGFLLGGLHWTLRSMGAARAGSKVRFGRILSGTIGFGFSAALGALAGGGGGILFSGVSPEWTAHALRLPSAADLPYAAAAIGAARGSLLAAAVYALSAIGPLFQRARRGEESVPAPA